MKQRAIETARVIHTLSGRSIARGSTAAASEIVITHGSGSRVHDTQGREYVDYLLGSGPLILGHAHPAVTAAVMEQAQRGSHYYVANSLALELARRVCEAVPCAERMVFALSGSEGVSMAIRIAKARSGRRLLVKFEGGYHGWSDHAYHNVGARLGPEPGKATPESAGISPQTSAEVLVARFNDLESLEALLDARGDEVAAVVMEAVQRFIPPRPGFLEGVREATRRRGIVLVFDEVVTGFRLALGGAQEYYGVTPDLAVFGKALGGGYPIAVVCGRDDHLASCGGPDSDAPIRFGGTFSGYPIGAAASLATLAELERPGTYERLHDLGQRARHALQAVFSAAGEPCQVVGEGPMLGLAFQTAPVTDLHSLQDADRAKLRRFLTGLIEHGILVNPGGSKLYLSTAHSPEDVDRLAGAAEQALRRVQSASDTSPAPVC